MKEDLLELVLGAALALFNAGVAAVLFCALLEIIQVIDLGEWL